MLLPLAFLLLLAATVVGGILNAGYRRDLKEHRDRVTHGGAVARTSRGPIEYAMSGFGAPALIIHGAGGGYDQGLMLGESFTGFQVIAPSRFGYLRTPTPADISPAAQADAHAALLDCLGIDKAIVSGASAGAPSAVELALRHPHRVCALVLIVPRGFAPGRPADAPTTHAGVLRTVLSGADFAYWAAMQIFRSKVVQFLGVSPQLEAQATPAERARVTRVMQSVLPLSMRIEGIRNDSAITLGPLPLKRIQAPTLVITARDDLFDTLPAAKHLAEQIPNARLIELENGGHLMVGRQAEVDAAIADFLSGISKRQQADPLRKRA
jgi:pimeloyl-ACP methyl ester carboxylesterase